MFQMVYPTGSVPIFKTDSHNDIEGLARIWDIVHSDDSWIDKPFFVNEQLFETREDYRDFYKYQHGILNSDKKEDKMMFNDNKVPAGEEIVHNYNSVRETILIAIKEVENS